MRLRSLLLADAEPRTPVEVVEWFGAMQAQDLASALWSLGRRIPGSTEQQLHAALEAGSILRTWPMRGTIHLVPSVDAGWMLELMATRALAAGARRHEQLGLTPGDADRATQALADALAGGRRLTRSEALAVISSAGISTDGQRGYHVLWHAAQVGVICIGPQADGEQTFVRLDEWCPRPRRLSARDGAAELAHRYFRSHGPASPQDFAGWTGLPLGQCRTAIADNEGRLVPVSLAGVTMWMAAADADTPPTRGRELVLPGFDEFMLGYKDRTLQVPPGRMDAIVPGGNGVFRATIVISGVVHGTWTRTLRPSSVAVTAELFEPLTPSRSAAVERAFASYARYLDRELRLTLTTA